LVERRNARAGAEILLVERDAALREVTSAWLRANDYAVREAASHSAAVLQLVSGRYDLVVFDVSLASAEQLTFAFWLGARRPRVPVIGTLHEKLTPRARECARELGIRLLLVKPYRLPVLLEAVRYALTNGLPGGDLDGRVQRKRPRGR
jgi:DNA-binding response OmpR family regulator